jgi:hypothetical protein
VWARLAGLVTRGESITLRELSLESAGKAAAVLRRAKAFRAAWYDVVTQPSPDPGSVEIVERETRRAGRALVLAPAMTGPAWEVPRDSLEAPVLLAAQAAWRMIDRGQLQHVGRCPGECCGWLFYDPEGRRRWCIMEICGNRDKVRRFRERQRGGRASNAR